MILKNRPASSTQTNRLTLIMIRHGQTVANQAGVIQGQDDSPLTPLGERSSRAKAEKLAHLPISAVYCSDLGRAKASLGAIMERLPGLPQPVFTKALREIDFGALTGSVKSGVMEAILRHKSDTWRKYPGGESGEDLLKRAAGFVEETLAQHAGGHVLAVTHYGIMETIARRYSGFPEEEAFLFGEEDLIALEFTGNGRAELKIL